MNNPVIYQLQKINEQTQEVEDTTIYLSETVEEQGRFIAALEKNERSPLFVYDLVDSNIVNGTDPLYGKFLTAIAAERQEESLFELPVPHKSNQNVRTYPLHDRSVANDICIRRAFLMVSQGYRVAG